MTTKNTWQEATHGSNWTNRTTGRKCILQSSDRGLWDKVKILHESGRVTTKQVHYFLYDYEKDE